MRAEQPGNITVYAPRLVAEGKVKEGGQFNLERLLPTAGWVKQAWEPSEEEFLSSSGLDAFVFMRIFIFSLKVFAVGGIIGMFVLLPINYAGSQLSDDSDFQHKSLDSFSISNVNNGSNRPDDIFVIFKLIKSKYALILDASSDLPGFGSRLWVHFCAAYIFTGIVCYLLFREYLYLSSKRIAYFYSSKPQPQQFTILVSGIPVTPGSTCHDTVERFFLEYHPSTYLSNSVIHRNNKLQSLLNDADKLYKKLTNLKQKNDAPKRQRRDGCLGICGRKVDIVDHYERRLGDIEDNVRMEQSSLEAKEVRAAFVTFKTRFGAAIALRIQESVNPTEWVTEKVPEPHDVYWAFFTVSFLRRWISKLFLSFVPPIMIMLSSMQGYISWSQIQKSACTKVLWFTVWNIFFANVLSGSALYRVNVFLEPKEIPRILAEAVPSQASFFIAYVVTSGWTTIASELFRLTTLLSNFMSRTFCRNSSDDFDPPSIPYHSEIPRIRLFGLLGVTYFILAPLILPFLLIYFCLGYIIFRNQLLKVYVPKFETGGEFWPTVHNSTIFSLILMHIIGIGIFGLKKLPLASILILPLPILTLLFNEYCQKRFFPIFKEYPAECLIKKDRADQNEHNMPEFYAELANAYNDPALKPKQKVQFSSGLAWHDVHGGALGESHLLTLISNDEHKTLHREVLATQVVFHGVSLDN
ncbi:unnamed protein product [Sphenostylis stenocarpa]|uniref:CSC1-like protein HYP1 n=1 Tax=Sphenostylis stenocarpa TaxID=92480 RepID=A0AA86SP11_9FABA|nr:unnamed protein product [Sphenostylis stenocarpa]